MVTRISISLFTPRYILHCALIVACLKIVFRKRWTCTTSKTRGTIRGKSYLMIIHSGLPNSYPIPHCGLPSSNPTRTISAYKCTQIQSAVSNEQRTQRSIAQLKRVSNVQQTQREIAQLKRTIEPFISALNSQRLQQI